MPQSRFGTSAVANKRSSDKRVFEVWAGIDAGVVNACSPMARDRAQRAKRAWLFDAQLRANIAQALGVAAVAIRDYWRRRLFPGSGTLRRSEPKISPNEPCPCGGGAKYKRCCGSRLRLVRD